MSHSQADPQTQKTETATFAGGCFWCMEGPFEVLEGVHTVVSGYMGGKKKNPTYEEVSSGSTGHAEVIQITYDPSKVKYSQLLDIFWMNIDPTTKDQQFADVGTQYRSEIFYHDESQKKEAEESKKKLAASGKFEKEIVTGISAASTFYPAEDYHQDYYKKNPTRYKQYYSGSGRKGFLEKTWGAKK